jgi:hypothetical protein
MAFRHILCCHWVVVEVSRRYWLQIQISVTKDDIDSSLHVLACEVAHPRTRYERAIFNFSNCANVAWYILQSMALGSTQPLAEMSKVKQPHYRPWQAPRFSGLWSSQILRQSAHEGGRPYAPAAFIPEELLLAPISIGARCGAVAEALCYKPEGRGIDSRWCQNFSLT